ncbi:hypothetical protein NL676_007991 [Syzygium grande]|nr:hypothetical protein NL676_007991 [Syzygium grande]
MCIGYARLINPALKRLLRGYPVSEFLEPKGCKGSKLISVESRGLRELVIDSPTFRPWDGSILNIRAPHLLKLRLLGNNTSIKFRLDRVTCLVEAELNFSIKIFGRNNAKARADLVKVLLKRLRHVTRLMIGSWCL